MSEENTINPVLIIVLGALMLMGLFIEASINMPHIVHAIFETLWVAIFASLIIWSVVVDTRQPQPEEIDSLAQSNAAVSPSKLVIIDRLARTSSSLQGTKKLYDARTMTEIFRKYLKKKH